MEIGAGERGPQTELLEFKVTSKPELRFEYWQLRENNGNKNLG